MCGVAPPSSPSPHSLPGPGASCPGCWEGRARPWVRESWLEAPGERRTWGAPEMHLGAELAGSLGLCSCLRGSEGARLLASPVTGPADWQGSRRLPGCVGRSAGRDEGEAAQQADLPEVRSSDSRDCPVHASACSLGEAKDQQQKAPPCCLALRGNPPSLPPGSSPVHWGKFWSTCVSPN